MGTLNPTAVPLPEQIAEIKREIGLRQRVYPRWIESGKLKRAAADHQMAAISSVLATLEGVQGMMASLEAGIK